MNFHRTLIALVPVLLLSAPAAAQEAEPATEPAEENVVPPSAIQSMTELLEPPEERIPRAELMELMEQRSRQLIERGRRLEQEHPDAANLYEVRELMLHSAAWLVMRDDPEAADQARDIARRILESDAPAAAKAQADFHLLRQDYLADADVTPADASRRIREFVDKYADTDGNVAALVRAAVLANQIRQPALLNQLLDELENHVDDPDARRLLRLAGRSPDVGRPFNAELTRLDGETLTLPDDLLGKVVVVDFWATWCAPCVESIPELKRIYDRYSDRGVEFVGISLDHDRTELEDMVRDRQLDWIHTFPGHEVAEAYGVLQRGIPSIWVVGKDGKVVSDDAKRNLEGVIRRALAAEPTVPEQTDADDE